MGQGFIFILNSILFGMALSMDAVAVSVANGLKENKMTRLKMLGIAGMFGTFQALMPLLGYLGTRGLELIFHGLNRFVPWIAMILLVFLGLQMIFPFIRKKEEEKEKRTGIGVGTVLLQALATSIDALSVGFSMADKSLSEAVLCIAIVGGVTFLLCLIALLVGKRIGAHYLQRAEKIGGIILIVIGIEIFVRGIFFTS